VPVNSTGSVDHRSPTKLKVPLALPALLPLNDTVKFACWPAGMETGNCRPETENSLLETLAWVRITGVVPLFATVADEKRSYPGLCYQNPQRRGLRAQPIDCWDFVRLRVRCSPCSRAAEPKSQAIRPALLRSLKSVQPYAPAVQKHLLRIPISPQKYRLGAD